MKMKKKEKQTFRSENFEPRVKMLTTLLVLALMTTCYSLALVCAAQDQRQIAQQHQIAQQQQQVFPAAVGSCSHNSHAGNTAAATDLQLASSKGNSIVVDTTTSASARYERTTGRRRRRRAARQTDNQLTGRGGSAQEPPQLRGDAGALDANSSSNGRPASSSYRQASGSLDEPLRQSSTTPASVAARPPSSIIRNVTAQNGQSVLLHCIVEPSSELVVSWFRGTGEPQLLTYETNTVIDDQRFVVRHGLLKDDDWALQIKNLDKTTDAGLYQCQTNSEPPQSQFYQLNIIEPQVNILGAPDMAVKLGSAINLTCVVSQSPDQLQFIFWYRNDRMINYDINERGKIVISKWPQKQETTTSNLQIFHSKLSDSGNYTCSPSGARSTSIYVHVLEGLDKRLIMFQNDNYEPSAASSQQTNSALSVHVVRLSRGRAYALFVAYVIFASWYQLVAQTQTCISLLLLSIIGFFLGKVTASDGSGAGGNEYRLDKKEAEAQQQGLDAPPGSIKHQESSVTMDPLIRRANSALNLLKSLSSGSSSSDDDDLDPDLEQPIGKHKKLAHKPLAAKAAAAANSQNGALNSPSGISTSSSSASTGYNSDSRSTNLIVVHPVGAADTQRISKRRRANNNPASRHTNDGDDEEDEMIELVSEPTAMNLVMEEFNDNKAPIRRLHPIVMKSLSPSPVFSNKSGSSSRLTPPIKPPRIEPQSTAGGAESHYSSPS